MLLQSTSRKMSRNRDGSRDLRITEGISNVSGIVSYVDEGSAFFDLQHTATFPFSNSKAMMSGDVFRTVTNFGDMVEDVDDFLSYADEVLVDIYRGASSPSSSLSSSPSSSPETTENVWCVSRVWLCPARRPNQYRTVADYVSRARPPSWPEQKRSHIPPRRWGEVVVILSGVLRLWSRVPVHLFGRIVSELIHRGDVGGVFDLYIKTDGDLLSFVRTAPQYFFVDDRMRICSYWGFSQAEFETDVAKICSELPTKSRRYSLDHIRVIGDVRECVRALKPMLKRARKRLSQGESPGLVVAFDCLGAYLGKKDELSLVQVASMTGVVYLFDVQRCASLFKDGLLAEVLESDAILKVVHDCRRLATRLFRLFGVRLINVFDTSIAYGVLQDQCAVITDRERERTAASLEEVCRMVGEDWAPEGQGPQLNDVTRPEVSIKRRPLTQDDMKNAASRVYCLVPNVYKILHRLIHPTWMGVLKMRCEDTIRECVEGNREKLRDSSLGSST